MINTSATLERVDALLAAAQNTTDQDIKDAALKEALRLMRAIREQVEIANMPPLVRLLYQQSGVIQ